MFEWIAVVFMAASTLNFFIYGTRIRMLSKRLDRLETLHPKR